MNVYGLSFLLILLLQGCVAPPVTQNKQNSEKQEEDSDIGGLEDYMEYHRYLREVVNALESDPEFRKKLEKAEEGDIKSGKIAEELEFVSHHVRNRLDEIKRVELNRLKDLTMQKQQLTGNGIDVEDPSHHHLDHANPHTFEIEDLKKLIAKTTEDLAEADKKRRDEFKQYELQKEFEKQNKLNHTNGEEREKLEKEFKEKEEQHKKHEKLHEPGHKAQLEEVWEKQDQMQQEFDPKTFFMLHDVDGNGLWDQLEVKALFVKELEKMYAEGRAEDDMRERAEEMELMRENVYKEVDTNRDGFIDYPEFLAQTQKREYQEDHGWKGLDERRPYTDEELQEYIRHQQMAQMHGYPPQGQYPQYQQPPPHYQQQQFQQNGYHPQQYNQPPHQQQFQQHPQAQQFQHQQAQQFQQPPQAYQQQHQQQQQFQQPHQPNIQYQQQPHPNNVQPPPPQQYQQPQQQPHVPQPPQQQPNNQPPQQQPNNQPPQQQPYVPPPQQPNVQPPQQSNVQPPQQPNVQPAQPPQQPIVQAPASNSPPQQNQQPLSNDIPQAKNPNVPPHQQPQVNQV